MLNLAVADAATRKACMCASNDGNRLIAVVNLTARLGTPRRPALLAPASSGAFVVLGRSGAAHAITCRCSRRCDSWPLRVSAFFASSPRFTDRRKMNGSRSRSSLRHFDRLMNDVQVLGLQVIPSIGAESWHEVANRWSHACNER